MTKERLLGTASARNALQERLAACPEVTEHDEEGHDSEALKLAVALSELERSFHRLLDEHLPALTGTELSPSEIEDLLVDIGEELRHIINHIRDPKYYRYTWAGAIYDRGAPSRN